MRNFKKIIKKSIITCILLISMIGTTCFAEELTIDNQSTFEKRESEWNHDYKMLTKGTYNCDYMDNFHNETKEMIDRTNCGTASLVLRSGLPCEPHKIFLQVVNTEDKIKYGSIALKQSDNQSYAYEFYLPEGTYLIDYIIAEGDVEGDFYIEPTMLEIAKNDYLTTFIPLKRQSTTIIDDIEYFIEDIEKLAEEEIKKEESLAEIENNGIYEPEITIKEAENNTEETIETLVDMTETEGSEISIIGAVIAAVLLVIIVIFIAKKMPKEKA